MKVREISSSYKILRDQPEQSFDGHTDFLKLTPHQRLLWLGQAAAFIYMNKGKAAQSSN